MKHPALFTLALTVLSLVACKDEGNPSCDDPVPFSINTPFDLCYGNTAYWEENNELTVTFKEVLTDNRCPEDATCIIGGGVAVELRFDNFDQAMTDTLALGEPVLLGHPDQVVFAGRTYRLLDVLPHPNTTQSIPLEAYKVRLVVEN